MAAFPNTFFTDSVGSRETGFQGTGLQDAENIKGEGPLVALGRRVGRARRGQPGARPRDQRGRRRPSRPDRQRAARLLQGRGEVGARRSSSVDGVRYSVPGDFARIEEGNKVTLLGRGSNCINTGGEKVYPEEVEMALKGHPDVYDVLVVGVADENYGQAVTAVVQPRERAPARRSRSCATFLRGELSGYKLPRSVSYVDQIPRSATGKANYPARQASSRCAAPSGADA